LTGKITFSMKTIAPANSVISPRFGESTSPSTTATTTRYAAT